MNPARERVEQLEKQIDWQKLVDMAIGDPPAPWELVSWKRHFSNSFTVAFDGPPTFYDYPEPVQNFLKAMLLIGPTRPCKGEEKMAAAKRAWIHAEFREGYEANLEVAQLCKELGISYNGRVINVRGETPSEAVISDIADSENCPFGEHRLRKVIKREK